MEFGFSYQGDKNNHIEDIKDRKTGKTSLSQLWFNCK